MLMGEALSRSWRSAFGQLFLNCQVRRQSSKLPKFFKQTSSRLLFDARLSFAEKIEKSRVQPMVSLQLVTNVLLPSLLVLTVW